MSAITFTAKIISLESTVWSLGVEIPLEISTTFIAANGKRCICLFNQSFRSHVALMPRGENRYFININKELQKKAERYRRKRYSTNNRKRHLSISNGCTGRTF